MNMKKDKTLIVHSEITGGYVEQKFLVSIEYATPYLAGSPSPILRGMNEGAESGYKLVQAKAIKGQLFNDNGIGRISLDIGLEGLYYLKLRAGHKLENLILDPPDLIADIYYSVDPTPNTDKFDTPNNSLMYSFLNLSNKKIITIRANLVKDNEDVYGQLRANPTDLIWRQYFIKRAITPIDQIFNPPHPQKKQEVKKEKPILTAKEAAEYLRMNPKTLQNYASEGKIEKLKGGKYRKEALDKYLEVAPKKKK